MSKKHCHVEMYRLADPPIPDRTAPLNQALHPRAILTVCLHTPPHSVHRIGAKLSAEARDRASSQFEEQWSAPVPIARKGTLAQLIEGHLQPHIRPARHQRGTVAFVQR